jgi:hypothetical protein
VTTYSHFLWNYVLARGKPRAWRVAFAFGAIIPDAVYFPLMARTLLEHGVSSWGDLAHWDAAASHPITLALHSFVPTAIVLAIVWATGWAVLTPWLWGILSHAAIDMLTHVSDAYPIFWPLADFRFPAPVSYWEPAYHGREFFLVEHGALAAVLLILGGRFIWRRFGSPFRRYPGPSSEERRSRAITTVE